MVGSTSTPLLAKGAWVLSTNFEKLRSGNLFVRLFFVNFPTSTRRNTLLVPDLAITFTSVVVAK